MSDDDAMLGERERTTPTPQPRTAVLSTGDVVSYTPTNHDAAPAARASAESVAPQPTAGDRSGNPTSHTGTGKQPAPPSVETDGFSPGSRTGTINRTPERQSPDRECGESALRDVPQLDNSRAAGGPEHHISDRSQPVKDDDSDRSKPINRMMERDADLLLKIGRLEERLGGER